LFDLSRNGHLREINILGEIQLSDQVTDVDFEFVYRFLAGESIWATGIGRDTQRRAIDNSLCISAFIDRKQVGFCRAVTDYATFVWVDDVFVDSNVRRRGIAKLLIQSIVEHPSLVSVASWWLSSSNEDARRLFQRFGFVVPEEHRIGKLMGRPKIKSDSYSK